MPGDCIVIYSNVENRLETLNTNCWIPMIPSNLQARKKPQNPEMSPEAPASS